MCCPSALRTAVCGCGGEQQPLIEEAPNKNLAGRKGAGQRATAGQRAAETNCSTDPIRDCDSTVEAECLTWGSPSASSTCSAVYYLRIRPLVPSLSPDKSWTAVCCSQHSLGIAASLASKRAQRHGGPVVGREKSLRARAIEGYLPPGLPACLGGACLSNWPVPTYLGYTGQFSQAPSIEGTV